MIGAEALRPAVRSARGMVASSQRDVSAVGAAVLADGGSAGDAALAMAAMSFMHLPGQCGLGGDAFAVWYDARTGRYRSVQGSGVGPDGADIAFYRSRGHDAVPLDGPLSVTVPGAVAAMRTLHRAAGTRPLRELWAPAVSAARDGVSVSPKTRADIITNTAKLQRDVAAAAVFLPRGVAPDVGEQLFQRDLADTLDHLADRPMDFYLGDVASECLRTLSSAGAPFSGSEWAETVAPAERTITGNYRVHTVHQNRPPSPGYMVLQQAAVLDGILTSDSWLSTSAVHWMALAAAHAFADRNAVVGSDAGTWRQLLDPAHAAGLRARISSGETARSSLPVSAGDTTSFVAVDAAGNAVSYIHSLAFTFGAGVMVPGTGIMLNDRLGRGAYFDDRHPNGLRPRRKPMHTLNAWIVADDRGRPAYVGNTPGGDGQVQWNMQLLSHLLDHGLDPQQAVDAPRFSVFPGSDADTVAASRELRVESRMDPWVIDDLRTLGHNVVVQGPWEGGGSAQIVAISPDSGAMVGGSDSRFEGAAVGA